MIKKLHPKYFQVIATFCLFLFLGLYVYKNNQILSILPSLSFFSLAVLLIIWITVYLFHGFRSKLLFEILGIDLCFSEWFGTTVIGTMSNYLLPQSGLVLRGSYFKISKKVPWSGFLAVQSAEYFIMFVVRGILGFFLTWLLPLDFKNKIIIGSFFFAVSLLGTVPLIAGKLRLTSEAWLIKKIKDILNGLDTISRSGKVYYCILIVSLLETFVMAAWFCVGYYAVGQPISFFSAFVLGLFMKISMFLPITPGNLGIQEIVIALYSSLIGQGFDIGLTVSLVLRSVSVIMSFTLGFIFSHLLMKNKNVNEQQV